MTIDPTRLRAATEDDVIEACEGSLTPISAKPADLLEFYNAMLDIMGVPDADGDVFDPDMLN